MTAPTEMPSELSPLLKEALAWVVRLHSGAATTDDAESIQVWRQQSAQHEQAFRDAVKLWRNFGDATRNLVASGRGPSSQSPVATQIRQLIGRRSVIGGAIAASLAAYFVVRPPLGLWPSFQELSADYRTGKGERRDIDLSNNVSLKLNTETSIAVRAAQNDPRIELISGEAVINTKRGPGAPVVVKAANGQIVATSAEFNARCLDGTVAVSCMDGSVTVQVNNRNITLHRGEQVSYGAAGFGVLGPLDPEQTTAWQKGLIIVRDRALADVIEEVNRYRPGKIIVLNARLAQQTITGTFHVDQLDDFVEQVHELFGASVRSLPGGVVLLS